LFLVYIEQQLLTTALCPISRIETLVVNIFSRQMGFWNSLCIFSKALIT
jgi:hypothetical protein